MSMQITGERAAQLAISTGAPTGNVGIDLSAAYAYQTMRPDKWIVSATVTTATSDLTLWGATALGAIDDSTDDLWGLHNDRYGRILNGKLGAALAVGSHHFIVTDIAIYSRIYFQKSAGNVDVFIIPIFKTDRSS